MKQNKDSQLRIRLTADQKEQIKEYCAKHNITISEFIRITCERIFQKEEN